MNVGYNRDSLTAMLASELIERSGTHDKSVCNQQDNLVFFCLIVFSAVTGG